MYVVVKNGTSVVSHGINKYTWKYLDEAKDFAKKQITSTEDTVEICELAPVITYNLKLIQEPEDVQEDNKCPVCGEPVGEGAQDTPEEPNEGEGDLERNPDEGEFTGPPDLEE